MPFALARDRLPLFIVLIAEGTFEKTTCHLSNHSGAWADPGTDGTCQEISVANVQSCHRH